MICSQWGSKRVRRSCWSVLKCTEGSYFISKDNLFFSVCHMVLQLQRSNRFVDVNFSSLLKNLSCVEIFIKYLDHCCQPGLLESRIPCWFCKQLWMVVFICLGFKDSFGKETWNTNCQLECSDFFLIEKMIKTSRY